MEPIDFSECERNDYRAYGGASGNKINVIYKGHGYMLKFPPSPGAISDLNYINSYLTEYIACHVFQSIGVPAQETLLGTFTDEQGGSWNVVACRDFTEGDRRLMEFAHLKNTCLSDTVDGYSTDLASILSAIDEQRLIISDRLRTFFWDQFIVDALLANFDRHNGNWGVLVNEKIKHADIAPVYDCGSCLFPQLDDKGMERVLSSPSEIDDRVRLFPKSTLMIDRARICYYEYITSLENYECDAALARLHRHIDMDRIEGILDDTPGLTPLQHRFYLTMISERKKGILDKAMDAMEHRRLRRGIAPAVLVCARLTSARRRRSGASRTVSGRSSCRRDCRRKRRPRMASPSGRGRTSRGPRRSFRRGTWSTGPPGWRSSRPRRPCSGGPGPPGRCPRGCGNSVPVLPCDAIPPTWI